MMRTDERSCLNRILFEYICKETKVLQRFLDPAATQPETQSLPSYLNLINWGRGHYSNGRFSLHYIFLPGVYIPLCLLMQGDLKLNFFIILTKKCLLIYICEPFSEGL